MTPSVSVIIPCRNEEKFIGKVLQNIIKQDYPPGKLEVFVVDGKSTDKTKDIIAGMLPQYPHFQLLDNPDKIVPHAMNLAIKKCKGDVVIRMDAHAIYPEDYISTLVKYLVELDADNVGGVWLTVSGANTLKAEAIAAATSHPFGIGNAHYRLGASAPMRVDTVPFGCYRKEVFDRIGLFDEDLIRNQDDEFNGRLIKHGGKIFIIPSVQMQYFARENFSKLSSMFYQYGFFKPLVNRKLGFPATWRQLIPPFFVLLNFFIFLLPLAGYRIPRILTGILASYLVAALVVAFSLSVKRKKFLAHYLILVFPLIHFSYGAGYLVGIFRFIFFKKKKIKPGEIQINR
jgi:glycosyltransferase involved in cell wall biosynthesis